MKPKISIIMSAYNALPYLKDAVESILNQTYKNFEFIIINDASTDSTLKYLKDLKDKRIKIFTNKTNLGLAASLNKALKASKGQYVARMDADDVSVPNRLKTQLNFLQKNPKIGVCGSFVAVINEKNEIIGHIKKPIYDEHIKKQLYWLTPLIHPTWFAKRKVFKTLDGYDEKWDYVEDFDFLIRAKKFRMENIPKELLQFRSQNKRRSQKDIEKIYKKGFQIRLFYFKKDKLGLSYFPYLLRSLVTTYFFPNFLKILINKKLKMA